MPDHKLHRKLSKHVLGEEHQDVHEAMDWPVKYLGKDHRVLFHDPLSVMTMFAGDKARVDAGLLHLLLDEKVSGEKEKLLLSLFLDELDR